MTRRSLLALALTSGGCSREPQQRAAEAPPQPAKPRPNPYGAEFEEQWGDGQAEIATYALSMPEGGKGEAVSVTVLQQYSSSARVPVQRAGSDAISALRLNLIRRYRIGAEDRSASLNLLVALPELNGLPAGAATDVSFTRQQWSGHSWRHLLFTKDRALIDTQEPETGTSRKQVSSPGMRVPEDALPLTARRLAWPRLRPGQRYRADVLASLESTEELQVSSVMLTLPEARETVDTPAGSFRCHRFTASWPDGRTKTWFIQGDAPYRVVRWQFSDGERADLLRAHRERL